MGLATSPLAPTSLADLPPIEGVRLAAASLELRYKGRPDVLLVECAAGTAVAGVFTRSTTAAAPVTWCRQALAQHQADKPCALLVNAGQANAFTGKQGEDDVASCIKAVTDKLQCPATNVYVASTGVIGQRMPVEKLASGIARLKVDGNDWAVAAEAIRTTDTFPKRLTSRVRLRGKDVTINGIAKGSGMIAPDMATMLGFVFTDAAIAPDVWSHLLQESNAMSFNCITVDGDSSTNDTLLAFATGKAGNEAIDNLHDPDFHDFRTVFQELMVELAQLIVRDGEGAQKFITVHVSGAQTKEAAHGIAMSIANSPLIKTAIAGEDANWGRVVMAIGKTRETVNQEEISIAFGEHIIARSGAAVPGYDEAPVAAYMKGRQIDITVEVGKGLGEAKVWTCDLTHGYIDINADYRS
jgi:glutamate N-acetyltransferase/amino-acid N-acetyltransferase